MHHHWASIKALATGLIIGLLGIFPAVATMNINPYFRAYTCSTTPVAFLSAQTSTTDSSTTYTFTDVSIGNPPCAGNIRLIYIAANCNAITANAANATTFSYNGVDLATGGSTGNADKNSTGPTVTGWFQDNSLRNTATIVFTVGGAGADATCERAVVLLYAFITTSTSPVDQVSDTNPTGDFDVSNVAVTSGGGEAVYIVAQSATACDLIDPLFNGTETVTEDGGAQIETALSYRSGHFTADSTATVDDYTNLSCGTETTGNATAISFPPPV